MTAPPRRVCVAVLTYRRPEEIERCLPVLMHQATELPGAVSALRADQPVVARVVVVDNDPQGGAREVVERIGGCQQPTGDSARLVTYAHEPEPGIAAARNRALTCADADDAVVFVDDDELVEPGWLAAMVTTWLSTDAAGVAGRVVPRYPGPVDPWIEAGRFFVRRTYPTGTPVAAAGAGNLLLDLAVLRRLGLRFDPAAGLTGGEDTMLTRTLVARGGTIVHCAEAVAVDPVPAARATRGWCLSRALSHGNTSALLDREQSSAASGARALLAAGGVGRIGFGLLRAGLGAVTGSPRHHARGLRLAARGAGITLGAAGVSYLEYARPGPDGRTRRLVRR